MIQSKTQKRSILDQVEQNPIHGKGYDHGRHDQSCFRPILDEYEDKEEQESGQDDRDHQWTGNIDQADLTDIVAHQGDRREYGE